ncbi:MAG: response regulator [Deltaproteobacteria bacterium]|nr:response regulator [Deltaproteobacteria bacterium]
MTPRVLVVDDDDGIRRAIATALGRSGFDVQTANDGAPALRLCELTAPDIVVVDYNMPTAGLAVVRTLKQSHGPSIYVAVLTGDDDPETRELCRKAGADAVLIKPITPTELRRVLTAAALALGATHAA